MKIISNVLSGLVIAYAAIASGIAPVAFFVAYAARANTIMMERLEEYHRSRHEYFFQGANERGLLDICNRDDGSVGVFFKEDCEAGR